MKSLILYFILFREYEDAYKIAEYLVNKENGCTNVYDLFLKLHYSEFWKEKRDSDYYDKLFEMSGKMSDNEWCELFDSKCGISNQIFDYEPLWKLYCLKKHN